MPKVDYYYENFLLHRTMYYTRNELLEESLSKANYDGSGRDVLVSDVRRLNGITVDYRSELCP